MLYPEYGLIVIGILMMSFALIMNAAGNLASKLVFNLIPFFGGVYVVLVGLTLGGWIVVGQ